MARRKRGEKAVVTKGQEDKGGTKPTPDEPKPDVQPPAQEAPPPEPGKVMILVPSIAGKSHVVTYEGGRFEMEMVDAERVEHVADFSGRQCGECGMELTGTEVEDSIRLTGQGENVWCPKCRAALRPTIQEKFARKIFSVYSRHEVPLGKRREALNWWARLHSALDAYIVQASGEGPCQVSLLELGGIALAAYEQEMLRTDLTT